eukprot:CAMPEP_0179901150 /NCGR_PEP_ID=MMETSP0982-20121206/39587_1 /TAXON_ID=483367 /ORGANISM="non described non described, Strain CCMP 2436" /LENGTH=139 /DNA_ID=CAMNT_0021799631 /DNA_START=395 /DNA_END=815 /DNA_ORIENTATION=-
MSAIAKASTSSWKASSRKWEGVSGRCASAGIEARREFTSFETLETEAIAEASLARARSAAIRAASAATILRASLSRKRPVSFRSVVRDCRAISIKCSGALGEPPAEARQVDGGGELGSLRLSAAAAAPAVAALRATLSA